jgi:hypothetical protein
MKFEEQFDGQTKEQVIEYAKRQNNLVSRREHDIAVLERETEVLEKEIDRLRLIEQNFKEQLTIQIALRTNEMSKQYFEFVHSITSLIKSMRGEK